MSGSLSRSVFSSVMKSHRRSWGKFTLPDGYSIAFQRWAQESGAASTSSIEGRSSGGDVAAKKKILAMHGWLDNSNSFSLLAPQLADRGFDIVATEHAGHGHSSHAPFGAVLSYSTYTEHAVAIMKELEWDSCLVLGHSMGAGVATSLAAAFPEKVEKLVLIEGLGRVSKPASTAASALRHAIEVRRKTLTRSAASAPAYSSFDEAVMARMRTVESFPGKQFLIESAARALVSRSVVSADFPELADEPEAGNVPGRVRFRHDPRLMVPSDTYFTPEQSNAMVAAIKCPVMLMNADNGWPFSHHDMKANEDILSEKGLLTKHHYNQGSHHPHLHPEVAPRMVEEIEKFVHREEALPAGSAVTPGGPKNALDGFQSKYNR